MSENSASEVASPPEEPGPNSPMESYLSEFGTSSDSQKHTTGPELLKYLEENTKIINEYGEITNFVERIAIHYITGQNPKVTVIGCKALGLIATAMGVRYRCCGESVFEKVIKKFAHDEEYVRASVRAYLVTTVEVGAHTPSEMIEHLLPLTSHINQKVCMEAERALTDILKISRGIQINNQTLVNLLNTQVRFSNTSVNYEISSIISDLCERLGRRFVLEALEKEQSRINRLIEEVKVKGLPDTKKDHKEEPDLAAAITQSIKKLTLPQKKEDEKEYPEQCQQPKPPLSTESKGAIRKRTALGQAMKEGSEEFSNSAGFEDIPSVQFKSKRDVELFIKKIVNDLKSGEERWQQKVNALQRIRSLILHGHQFKDDIIKLISNLRTPFKMCLQDQRSQVVKEVNVTISYICKELKNLADIYCISMILPFIINNVISSEKVVASSSSATLKIVFSNIYHEKLISQLVFQMNNSKLKEIVVTGAQCLMVMLKEWPIDQLKPHIANLQRALLIGFNDLSMDSRAATSKAFWAFRNHFPEEGDSLLDKMDTVVKKQLFATLQKSGVDVQNWQQQLWQQKLRQQKLQQQKLQQQKLQQRKLWQQPRSSQASAPPRVSGSVAPVRSIRPSIVSNMKAALESQAHRQLLRRDTVEEGQKSAGRHRVQDQGRYTTRDASASQPSSRSRTPGFHFTEKSQLVMEKETRRKNRALSLCQRISPGPSDINREKTEEAEHHANDNQHFLDQTSCPVACVMCGDMADKFCIKCSGQPALHPVNCFKEFHSLQEWKLGK